MQSAATLRGERNIKDINTSVRFYANIKDAKQENIHNYFT